jgi:hypothetical protein
MRPCALPLIYIAASALELEVSVVPEMAWLAEMIISCPSTFQPAGWCAAPRGGARASRGAREGARARARGPLARRRRRRAP